MGNTALWSGASGLSSGGGFGSSYSGLSEGGASAPVPPGEPDFTLSANTVTTTWGTQPIGDLTAINAPAGAYFVLVNEDAGLAVVNG